MQDWVCCSRCSKHYSEIKNKFEVEIKPVGKKDLFCERCYADYLYFLTGNPEVYVSFCECQGSCDECSCEGGCSGSCE